VEVEAIGYEGLPTMAVLHRLLDTVISRHDIANVKKAVVAEKVAKADRMISDGANESLQLLDVAGLIMREVGSAPPLNQGGEEAMVVGE